MNILIVEDEPPVARELRRQMKNLLGNSAITIRIESSLEGARCYFTEKPVDLLILDLDLDGDDGFKLLDIVHDLNFYTIVVSAGSERAIEAFERGIVDFLPKPCTEARLQIALNRLQERKRKKPVMKKLAIPTDTGLQILNSDNILFFSADGKKTRAYMNGGQVLFLKRNLGAISGNLPDTFIRVHKSYIVNTPHITEVQQVSERNYHVILSDNSEIQVSRSYTHKLKEIILTVK